MCNFSSIIVLIVFSRCSPAVRSFDFVTIGSWTWLRVILQEQMICETLSSALSCLERRSSLSSFSSSDMPKDTLDGNELRRSSSPVITSSVLQSICDTTRRDVVRFVNNPFNHVLRRDQSSADFPLNYEVTGKNRFVFWLYGDHIEGHWNEIWGWSINKRRDASTYL